MKPTLQTTMKTATVAALCLFLAPAAHAASLDAKLSTEDVAAYRQSLDAVWPNLTEAQQKAYNWAVGNASVYQLRVKYPELTPRKLIERESDEYIARKSRDLADLTAELAAKADELARAESQVREVQAELAKLTAQDQGLQQIPNATGGEELRFNFSVHNASRFDVTRVQWDARLFINDEASDQPEAGRYCQIALDYQADGGLAAGQSKNGFVTLVGIGQQCPRWRTLEVQNAAKRVVNMVLDAGSVTDFSGQRVLPHVSRPRADYESAIANAQADLRVAQTMKASLNP